MGAAESETQRSVRASGQAMPCAPRVVPAALVILIVMSACGSSSGGAQVSAPSSPRSSTTEQASTPTVRVAAVSGIRCVGEGRTCWATTNDPRTHRARVVRSNDGGRTWRDARLPLPAPFSPDLGSDARVLRAVGADVVVEVDRPTGLFYAVSFVASRDRGHTFTTRDWPDTADFRNPNGTGYPFLATIHDATHWTVVLNDAADQSDDAGATWHRYALPPGLEARGVSWSTIDTGTIVATTPDQGTVVLHTIDGGKSWAAPRS